MSVTSISAILENALAGDPWHGPSLKALLDDVTPEEAAARPIAGAHSILELVLHAAAWAGEVAARAKGREPAMPDEGDWARAEGVTLADARARLVKAHAALAEALAGFPEARLTEMVGPSRDTPLGSGVTFERMLLGVAEHDAYHGGQVAMLKRALRG